jgi:mannitol operon transcriptional antiterminator
MLNKRCLSIIRHLVDTHQTTSIRALADKFSVSTRTIQYDLRKIAAWCCRHELPSLASTGYGGVEISGGADTRESLKQLLNQLSAHEYVYSPKERTFIILDRLLSAGSEPISLSKIADELNVSVGTVFRDSLQAKEQASRYGLHLKSKSRVGTWIEGDEEAKRRAYSDMLWSLLALSRDENAESTATEAIVEWKQAKTPISILRDIDIAPIVKGVLFFEDRCQVSLTDHGFAKLCINIAVAIHRSLLGYEVSISPEELTYLHGQREYATAQELKSELEKYLKIEIPDNEVAQITLYLLGATVQVYHAIRDHSDNEPVYLESVIAARRVIEQVEEVLYIDLEDPSLLVDLAGQLRSYYYRERFNLPEESNPLLEEVKTYYPDVYQAANAATVAVLGEETPESEIGYIAMHICAAIYKSMQIKQPVKTRVLVICGLGLGSAKLLTSRLEAVFDNIEIVAVEPYHNLYQYLERHSYDLLISTFPLDEPSLEYVLVSPFLTEDDIQRLRQHLQLRVQPRDSRYSVRSIIDTVANLTGLDDLEKLQVEINVLKHMLPQERQSQPIRLPGFADLLKHEAIILKRQARDWREAIRLAGKPLVSLGYITDRYVDAMIANKERLGEYIVIARGVAFPHASPKDGVNRTCFSILTLMEPVHFGHPKNDPVDVVIAMGCSNSWIHTQALSDLLRILSNPSLMQRIRNAWQPNEVLSACTLQ